MAGRLRTLGRFWLEALCVVLVCALTFTVPAAWVNGTDRRALEQRVDQLEESDVEQMSLLLCGVAVDRRIAVLLDGLIDENTQLVVDGEPDPTACEVEP